MRLLIKSTPYVIDNAVLNDKSAIRVENLDYNSNRTYNSGNNSIELYDKNTNDKIKVCYGSTCEQWPVIHLGDTIMLVFSVIILLVIFINRKKLKDGRIFFSTAQRSNTADRENKIQDNDVGGVL